MGAAEMPRLPVSCVTVEVSDAESPRCEDFGTRGRGPYPDIQQPRLYGHAPTRCRATWTNQRSTSDARPDEVHAPRVDVMTLFCSSSMVGNRDGGELAACCLGSVSPLCRISRIWAAARERRTPSKLTENRRAGAAPADHRRGKPCLPPACLWAAALSRAPVRSGAGQHDSAAGSLPPYVGFLGSTQPWGEEGPARGQC